MTNETPQSIDFKEASPKKPAQKRETADVNGKLNNEAFLKFIAEIQKNLENSAIKPEYKEEIGQLIKSNIDRWNEEMRKLDTDKQGNLTILSETLSQELEEIIAIIAILSDKDELTLEEAHHLIKFERKNLGFLMGDKNHVTLDYLVEKAQKRNKPITEIQYDWQALRKNLDAYPANEGENCCALTVSTLLGLKDKRPNVDGICADLIAGNLAKTGKPGLCFGFSKCKAGTVLVWKSSRDEKAGYRPFRHVGIVRFKEKIPVYDENGSEISNDEYICIVEEGGSLEANIVPVNPQSKGTETLRKALSNQSTREAYIKANPHLREIFAERKNIYVRDNKNHWGDASSNANGEIAFGIQTENLAINNQQKAAK